MEGRLAGYEEEIKMRDELLAESECKLQEGYELKYELGDLKDRLSEL